MSRQSIFWRGTVISLVTILAVFPISALAAGSVVKSVSAGHILVLADGNTTKTVVLDGVWSPAPSTPLGQEARDFTTQHAMGEGVNVSQVEEREGVTYVNVVLPDGQPLSKLLVAGGLARWNGHKGALSKDLEKAQQSARDQGLGIWGSPYGGPSSTGWPVSGVGNASDLRLRPHQMLTIKGDPAVTAAVRSQFDREKSERIAKQLQEEMARQAAEEAQWLAAQQPPQGMTPSDGNTADASASRAADASQTQSGNAQTATQDTRVPEVMYDYPPFPPYGPDFGPWGYYEPPFAYFEPFYPYAQGPAGFFQGRSALTYVSPGLR